MTLQLISLDNPKILDTAQHLSAKGMTQLTANNLFYLNLDDNYIHHLFPLLKDPHIQKPDYFQEKAIGAHITIIYPEENKKIDQNDLDQQYHFFVKNIVSTIINKKIYYVLLIESPALFNLRKKYDLPDLLCFKNYLVPFHITIGVKKIDNV